MLAHGPLPMCSSLCGLSADRAFHKKVLFPKFRKYYAAELVLTILFFRERNLRTYSEAAHGATAGYYFTNQQHTDEDDGYTLLSAIGQPSGGGEFYHADAGRAHVVCAGDILFVNPQSRHGTAEFRIEQGDAMRVMFAFFLKSESVVALGVGAADSEKRGLDQSWRAAKPAKRAKRGAR